MHQNKTYSSDQIVAVAQAIDGNNSAYNWLKRNQFNELAALCCAVRQEDNTNALEWFYRYNYRTLYSFIRALEGDEASFQYLMNNRGIVWAATVSAVNQENKSEEWLVRFHFKHFLILAQAIRSHFYRNNNDKGSIGGFGGGSIGGGGGFGGFAGGSFGGGGSGGSW